ncbi:MAG: molecular chaperone HtpG [Candidatus Omnitrophica bacterium]|nr:molecular chaperone HtpG [Candidatus Omnitrophota bacterium]
MSEKQTFEYKAEMKQLLNLIIHSLYTHPEIFLRELISNSSDALNKLRIKMLTDNNVFQKDKELGIWIEFDSKARTFSIEDSGIGMTKEEVVNNLGTIARSGTLEFLEEIKKNKQTSQENLIGQFGVGFYSVFMVTEEVTVETRSWLNDEKGCKWVSKGEGSYTIEDMNKTTRGTKISFKLKDEYKDFAEEYKVKNIIEKYSNFTNFPIYVKNTKVNTISALWHKAEKDISLEEANEFYKYITDDYSEPLGYKHISIDGKVNFKSLVFIPSTAPFDLMRVHTERSLHLYSNKVLIQKDCKDLLPEYLCFVRGVVDTVDLPLNVSREVTQSSPVMENIKNILTREILGLLKNWQEKDIEKYKKFYDNFGRMLATGVNSDFKNKDKIVDLLLFRSTKATDNKGNSVSLKDYVLRMKPSQKEIYYLSGQTEDSIIKNPNLEYFNKNDLEVLLLTDPVEVYIMPFINEYNKHQVKSIDKADIELKPEDKAEKPEDDLAVSLLGKFKVVLNDKVEDVVLSKRLVESPVTLVTSKEGLDPQMEKLMRTMNKDFLGSKKIMEINASHPLVRNLSKRLSDNDKDPIIEKCIVQLFEGAKFLEGSLESSADFIKRMTEIMEQATNK